MVAPSKTSPVAEASGTEKAPPEAGGTHARGGVRRLLTSALRIADLQYRIWLTQAKLTVQRMAFFATLFGIAAVLGLLAIIFLYIGVFHLLTDIAGLAPVWAYLIYGGFHIVLAGILIAVGTSILGKKDESRDETAREERDK